jgi:biopolymer transport protein ExbD
MKYTFLILMLFFQGQLIGQIDLEVPHFRSVQIDYDLTDYVSVSIDKNGGLYIENDSIAFSDLRKNLFEIIKYKSKYQELRLSIMIIELVVDQDLTYEKLEKILFEFPKLGILKIHFVGNSNDKIRFEQICTTGFLFRMNHNDNNNSVINEVMDSLKSEMDEEFIKLNQGYFK